MSEYGLVLQTISDAENRVVTFALTLRSVSAALTDGSNRLCSGVGSKIWNGTRVWSVGEDGSLITTRRDNSLPHNVTSQLCDTLQELATAIDRKNEIDEELKHMGYESLIKRPQ